jgi:uncharacterized protein YutE (UPF0331/DUF86 family)
VLDRERILAKLDEVDGYLAELRQVVPGSFAEYEESVAQRRATERLLQIAIESVLDICSLFVSGLRLGLPAEEDDLIEKLERAALVSSNLAALLRSMRGFRNLLVHEYGRVDDAIVYGVAANRLQDFVTFKLGILEALRRGEAS